MPATVPPWEERSGFCVTGDPADAATQSTLLYYRLVGPDKAPTKVLFIMGLTARHCDWWLSLEYFGVRHGDQFQCCAIDNRGVGLSTSSLAQLVAHEKSVPDDKLAVSDVAGSSAWRMDLFARDALDVVRTLGWTDFHVVGISMGGMIAQELAGLVATHSGSPDVSTSAADATRLSHSGDALVSIGAPPCAPAQRYAGMRIASLHLLNTISNGRNPVTSVSGLRGIFGPTVRESAAQMTDKVLGRAVSSETHARTEQSRSSEATAANSAAPATPTSNDVPVFPPLQDARQRRKLLSILEPLAPRAWLEQYRELDLAALEREAERGSPACAAMAGFLRWELRKLVKRGEFKQVPNPVRMWNCKWLQALQVARTLWVPLGALAFAQGEAPGPGETVPIDAAAMEALQTFAVRTGVSVSQSELAARAATALRAHCRARLGICEPKPGKEARRPMLPICSGTVMLKQMRAIATFAVPAELHRKIRAHVRGAICVQVGDLDTIVPPSSGEHIAEALDADLFVRWFGGGHACNDQFPEAVHAVMRRAFEAKARGPGEQREQITRGEIGGSGSGSKARGQAAAVDVTVGKVMLSADSLAGADREFSSVVADVLSLGVPTRSWQHVGCALRPGGGEPAGAAFCMDLPSAGDSVACRLTTRGNHAANRSQPALSAKL